VRLKDLSRLELLALIAVLTLAAILRFGWLGVNSFTFDEAHLSLISLQMGREGQFATMGMPSSVGVPNLPAAAWVFALPYALSPDPLVATLFVSALSFLAVVALWALVRTQWGVWPALVAALFMAASPYSVLYSRSIWAQNLLAIMAVAWLWAAHHAQARRNPYALSASILIAGFAFQVHYAGAALILATAYLFVRFRWWQRLIPVIVGVLLVVLTLLPFVVEVLCCSPQVVDQFTQSLGGESQIDLTALQETLRLALTSEWQYLAAGEAPLSFSPHLPTLILVPLLLLGLAALFIRRKDSPLLTELTLVLLLAAPIVFTRHSTPVYIHYQLTALPAIALILAASTRLFQHRTWPLLITALMALTAGLWAVQIGESLTLTGTTAHAGGIGTPLGIVREIAASAPTDRPPLLFTHGDNVSVDGEAAIFHALWWERPDRRIIAGQSLLILPDEPAYMLATLPHFQAWEELEAAGLALNPQRYPRRENEGEGFIATLYDGQTPPEGFTLETPITLENGLRFEGWKTRQVGERLRISTLWTVLEPPPPATYQQFHHLRNATTLEGDPLDGSDIPISAHSWQVGDRLIFMADFFREADEPLWVEIGQYTLPDMQRIPNSQNTDLIRLGPFGPESD
jgi:hypothetical protein